MVSNDILNNELTDLKFKTIKILDTIINIYINLNFEHNLEKLYKKPAGWSFFF